MPAVAYKELRAKDNGITSAEMRRGVEAARATQAWRGFYNAHIRILKVARTIADLDLAESISAKHLAEAVQYQAPRARRRLGLSARAPHRHLERALAGRNYWS